MPLSKRSPDIDVRVVRVRRPETIADPRVATLIGRAILGVDYPGTTPEALYAEWAGQVHLDTLGLFIGFEENNPRAIAVIILPSSHAMIAPQALLVYSEGKPELARRIGKRVRVWLMENGFNKLLGVNLYRDDEVFMRGFRHIGRAKRLGSLLEFTF